MSFVASRINYLLHLAEPSHIRFKELNKGGKESTLPQNGVSMDPNNNFKGNGHQVPAINKVTNVNGQHNSAPPNPQLSSLLNMLDAKRMERSKAANGKANVGPDDTFTVSAIGNAATNAKTAAKTAVKDKIGHEHQKATARKAIPNVFDDNIFDFLTQQNDDRKESISAKYGSNKDVKASHDVGRQQQQQRADRNWREKLNEPIQPPVERWRSKKDGPDSAAKITTSTPVTEASATKPPGITAPIRSSNSQASAAQATTSHASANNQPAKPMASKPPMQSIIQNGAILTGAIIKPCPTYAMDNLYAKFPHLNPNKVPNPLKSTPMDQLGRPPPPINNNTHRTQSTLQHFFDKVIEKNAKKGEMGRPGLNSLNEMKELTSSLMSLPGQSTDQMQSGVNRMPQRSVSSINLPGISRMTGANPQKGRKSPQPQQANGQARQNGNQRQQSANQNNRSKGEFLPFRLFPSIYS